MLPEETVVFSEIVRPAKLLRDWKEYVGAFCTKEGTANITQEIETKIGGNILGIIAVSSKRRRNGALVRMVIHANASANRSDKPEAPRPKMNELRSKG